MIDGFNILNLKVNENDLLHNKLLKFNNVIDQEGEILKESATYQNLTFTIKYLDEQRPYKNTKIIRKLEGSIHYYFNNGKHNYNDFNYINFEKNVFDICNKFNINPKTVAGSALSEREKRRRK